MTTRLEAARIPAANRNGDCYEAAGRYVMDHGLAEPDLVLVHGLPMGQGPIAGVRFGHAWVEKGSTVIDESNGRHIRMPKSVYYAIGRIEVTVRYTVAEFREEVSRAGHWGPWEGRVS